MDVNTTVAFLDISLNLCIGYLITSPYGDTFLVCADCGAVFDDPDDYRIVYNCGEWRQPEVLEEALNFNDRYRNFIEPCIKKLNEFWDKHPELDGNDVLRYWDEVSSS